jgi:hypothetical protein
MNALKRIVTHVLAGISLLTPQTAGGFAQQNSVAKTNAQQTPAERPPERDGQHDFDPLIGKWKYHLKRRLRPLTGSNTWVELDGLESASRFGMAAPNWTRSTSMAQQATSKV